MWRKKINTIKTLSILIYLIGIGSFCEAFTLTLEDISEGIDSRQTKVTSIELQYSINNTNEDAYYEKLNKDFERLKSFAKDGDRIDLPVPENKTLDRKSENAFHIFVDGNKKAYQIFNVDFAKDERVLISKAVYDGEKFKFLNVPELNGVIERRLPQDVIEFPTIPKMLGLEGYDLGDYIKREGIEVEIVNESVVDGDMIIDLSIKRSFMPSPQAPVEIVTEHEVKLNASKDFWPIQIDCYTEFKNIETGDSARALNTSVKISGFVENNGMYYPKSFESIENDHDFKYEEAYSYVPTFTATKVVSKMSVETEILKVNPDIPNSVFEFEFPHGTRFHDSIGGFGMIVGDDPEKLAEYMVASMEALDVDLFSKQEAREILALRRAGRNEEAEKLRESIIAKKTGIGSEVENVQIQNTAPAKKAIPPESVEVQVPVVYSNKATIPFYHYLILAALFCIFFGLTFLFLRKRRK